MLWELTPFLARLGEQPMVCLFLYLRSETLPDYFFLIGWERAVVEPGISRFTVCDLLSDLLQRPL